SFWGWWRFLALFLTATIGGGCAVVLDGSDGMGAFGADCGLLVSCVVWLFANSRALPPEIARGLKRSLLGNVVFLGLLVGISAVIGMRAAAPIGGAIAGFVFALPCLLSSAKPIALRGLGFAGMLAVPALILAVVALSSERIKEAERQRLAEARKEME